MDGDKAQGKALRALLEACKVVVEGERSDLPVTILTTFIAVALYGHKKGDREEPLTFKEIGLKTGLPYTTISRHMRYLGEWQKPMVPGYGLIATESWIMNQRQKLAYLTPKGQRLAERLGYLIASGAEDEE